MNKMEGLHGEEIWEDECKVSMVKYCHVAQPIILAVLKLPRHLLMQCGYYIFTHLNIFLVPMSNVTFVMTSFKHSNTKPSQNPSNTHFTSPKLIFSNYTAEFEGAWRLIPFVGMCLSFSTFILSYSFLHTNMNSQQLVFSFVLDWCLSCFFLLTC